ncbi:hypothetical protein XELAEV_18042683mg [Xenopus laevis]|uniref:Olfactory receptor n=1 Tax=Xenopus laevis TaxID=8355 RepID=A0A974C4N8_XENLA|nr:hypothetical protein XELAEV_18042683mg [Xenopus laevis]
MKNVTENQTMNYGFCLLGFQIFCSLKIPFFLLILILYIIIIIGNGTISALILSCHSLSHPMFFFLSHLSFCDITLTTTIVPTMLDGILRGVVQISVSACLAQFQILCAAVASECFLLAAISFDRYLAICNPLRYVYIMRKELCFQLVILCWALGCSITFNLTVLISKLEFCGPNIIDHFFCDFLPILQLSCSDTSAVKLGQLFVATTIAVFSVISIIVTYIYILSTIFRIQSASGRQKALSTCSSHMAVLGTFLGSLIGLYLLPSHGKTLNANKVLSLLYTVVTPLFNPIIYSLRNSEIRVAVKKSFKKLNCKFIA